MDILKSIKAMQSLDSKIYKICTDVDAFVETILKWGEEIQEIVEREFSTENNMSTFLLPKTLSEKKLRKTKKALVQKNSKANATLVMNDTIDLDSTRITRTRAASRVLKSKMSQLPFLNSCTPSDQNEAGVPLNETLQKGNNNEVTLSNDTFVVPNATSTRTKPVVRKKRSPTAFIENIIEKGGMQKPSNVTNEVSGGGLSSVPEQRQSRNRISVNCDEITNRRASKSLFSRTFSEGPLTRSSKSKPLEESNPCSGEGSVRKKVSRALSESPVNRPSKISKNHGVESAEIAEKTPEEQRPSMFRAYRTSSQSPIMRNEKTIAPETPSGSSRLRSSSLRPVETASKSPASRNGDPPTKSENLVNLEDSFTEKTTSIDKERTPESAQTYVLDGVRNADESEVGKTPVPAGATFTRYSQKTSTPVAEKEKTLLFEGEEIESVDGKIPSDEIVDESEEERNQVGSDCKNSHSSFDSAKKEEGEGESIENPVGKKKKRSRKNDLGEKSADEFPLPDTGRITRTKSKAIKEMLKDAETNANESTNQHHDLSAFAKKFLKKAKMNSQKKNQLVAVLESNGTPNNFRPGNFPSGVLTSKSKYKLLLSSSKKLKTPLATLPNSSVKRPKRLDEKNKLKSKIAKRDSSVENFTGSATKPFRVIEDEVILKTRKKKEEEVVKKKQNVIKQKQEELRRKNELKQQLVLKQREKLEQEKYYNMIQMEKEKEERHKLILQERQMKMKEEAFKKKMMTEQKMAETIERRKMEEKARLAKLKELEAEEQRLALEKQREQEEKLAQERLAMKKAREEQEWLLKQEIEMEKWKMKAEKAAAAGSASKKFLPSGSKMQNWMKKTEKKKEWDYKPRSENDYGLEDEDEDWDMDGEGERVKSKKRIPAWSTRVLTRKCPRINVLTIEMVSEYMPCHQKSPDIQKMFGMTPTKRIKRTSSAIWNTPNSMS